MLYFIEGFYSSDACSDYWDKYYFSISKKRLGWEIARYKDFKSIKGFEYRNGRIPIYWLYI